MTTLTPAQDEFSSELDAYLASEENRAYSYGYMAKIKSVRNKTDMLPNPHKEGTSEYKAWELGVSHASVGGPGCA